MHDRFSTNSYTVYNNIYHGNFVFQFYIGYHNIVIGIYCYSHSRDDRFFVGTYNIDLKLLRIKKHLSSGPGKIQHTSAPLQ